MPASVQYKRNDDAIPMIDTSLLTVLIAALVASASPGPATLAIAGTSMSSGRWCGLAVAAGVTTGSLIWSTTKRPLIGRSGGQRGNSGFDQFGRRLLVPAKTDGPDEVQIVDR